MWPEIGAVAVSSDRIRAAAAADALETRIVHHAATSSSGMLLSSEFNESVDAKRREAQECRPCAWALLRESGAEQSGEVLLSFVELGVDEATRSGDFCRTKSTGVGGGA